MALMRHSVVLFDAQGQSPDLYFITYPELLYQKLLEMRL